jgi:Rrf2 family transcriptional regulator, cysteine metabolism repressor
MMFSTRAEYGVRVMIQLGRRHGSGPVPLAEIAQAENLPLSYLEHLVARLRKAELVASTRGAHGGYELTRAPEDITMASVVHALEGSLAPMQCFDDPVSSRVLCNHELDGYENCATKLLWTRVQGGVARALEQTTLAELVAFAARKPGSPERPRHVSRRRSHVRPTTSTPT